MLTNKQEMQHKKTIKWCVCVCVPVYKQVNVSIYQEQVVLNVFDNLSGVSVAILWSL